MNSEMANLAHTQFACMEFDSLSLAQEAVRAGLVNREVLDHLTSLHPEVPNSMKHRMVEILVKFKFSPVSAKEDFPLSAEHIPDLNEFLIGDAYLWRDLGTVLRFQPKDLKNIELTPQLMARAPQSYMTRILEDWVEKKHEYTVPPTVNNLESALRSGTVERTTLANELRTKICKFTVKPTQPLPYFITGAHITQWGEVVSSNSGVSVLETAENVSVMLEVQVTADKQDAFKCHWLCNGKHILFPSSIHSGINTPFLYISNPDIDMDGWKYSCELKVSEVHVRVCVLRVSCPLDKHTSSLASLYSAQPEVPKDTWPPVSSKKYINLALIKQEEVVYNTMYARLTIRGNVDDILQDKEIIEYETIIKSIRSGDVIFIEGRPGCGKTTFVHKITRDWAAEPRRAFRLVLLVSLRVLNVLNKPKLELSDILNLFKDQNISEEMITIRSGHGVCFIFDGLDEFSPLDGETSIVYRIIDKKYLSRSTVIVASRPAAVRRRDANKVIEVLGFRKEQIFEYFDHYPFCNESQCMKLQEYLASHPNIAHMCYLPIHAAMVAFLFDVTGKVPKTETEIYTHFTKFTLKRSLSKHEVAVDVHNLTGEQKTLFMQICQLALDKTILNKQVLLQDEVKSSFKPKKDGDISLGLITVDCTADLYGFKDIYTFLHLTFQEYLAAYHISTLSKEVQDKLILEHGQKEHMLVVWKFYCGLKDFNHGDSKFKAILKMTEGKVLFHFQCAYESQQLLTCTQLLKSIKYCLFFTDEYLTTPDFTAIGYALNKSVLPTKLSIINCKVNIEAVHALQLETFANLKELSLANCHVGAMLLASSLTSCQKLEKICICGNDLSKEGVAAIFSSISRCILKVCSKDVTVGNNLTCEQLTLVLQCCTNLQSLSISLDTVLIEKQL